MEETNNIRIVTLDHLQHTFGSQFVAVATTELLNNELLMTLLAT